MTRPGMLLHYVSGLMAIGSVVDMWSVPCIDAVQHVVYCERPTELDMVHVTGTMPEVNIMA